MAEQSIRKNQCGGASKIRPEVFWSRVKKSGPGDCWIWHGPKAGKGYGTMCHVYAHRYSYESTNGPIPRGLSVLHKCDNPPCVNPAHLFVGTHADNAADMIAKRRSGFGEKNSQSKLTEPQVIEMRRSLSDGATESEVARMFNVDRALVAMISQGRRWAYLGPKVGRGRRRGADAPQSKYGPDFARKALGMVASGLSQRAAARKLGMSHSQVRQMVLGTHWSVREKATT